jgi:hypothetical protein
VKVLLDENLSSLHASGLRDEGHDALAVVEVGLSGSSDERVLHFAVESGGVLITCGGRRQKIRIRPESRY